MKIVKYYIETADTVEILADFVNEAIKDEGFQPWGDTFVTTWESLERRGWDYNQPMVRYESE